MKNIFRRKLNISRLFFAVLVLLVFAMPACVTVSILRRNDAVDEIRDSYVENVKTKDKPAEKKTDPIDFEDVSEEPLTAVSSVEEISTLTSVEPEASVTDATPSDATYSDATDSDAVSDAAETYLNGKKVYLTFDDGPSDYTEEILDILDEEGVKASFFVVVNSLDHKNELKDIVERGHTIGLHSSSHVYSTIYSDLDSFIDDVEGVRRWVKALTGVDTKYYRFPGGSSNIVADVSMGDCIKYLNENGYTYFDWNAMSGDAEDLSISSQTLYDNSLNYIRNNEGDSILLMHDLDEHYNTVEALPKIIRQLKAEGYELCPLDDASPKCHHRDE